MANVEGIRLPEAPVEVRLMKITEVVRLTGLERNKLTEWCREGRLTNYSPNSHWRIDYNELVEFLKAEGAKQLAKKQGGN